MEDILDRIRNKVTLVERTKTDNTFNDTIVTIKQLYLGRALVPVICEDMYEYEDPKTGLRQSLHSYIVETIIRNFSDQGKVINLTEKELRDIVNEGYFGTSLLEEKTNAKLYSEIYKAVIDEDLNINGNIHLKKEVFEFLTKCEFPLIVTTSCFPILEHFLGDKYTSYWCRIGKKNDAPLKQKMIYHIFGEAHSANSDWGYNDQQLIRFLRQSFTSEYALKNLTTYINVSSQKTLLVLGNDAPDWLFRFMLAPIYGDDMYDSKIGFYMDAGNRLASGSLNLFLREIHFEKDSQISLVLPKIVERISNKQMNKSNKSKFFIAHASENNDITKKLVFWLETNGVDVWVDYSDIKDGVYWNRIIQGLQECSHFMPIISESYIQKTMSKKKLKEVLSSLDTEQVLLDSDFALTLNKDCGVEGVQVELLLASKWLKDHPRDSYSIPVILSGEEFYDEPIFPGRVENWGKESRRLPENLFWGIQMYEFNPEKPESFVLDWDRYKSNK